MESKTSPVADIGERASAGGARWRSVGALAGMYGFHHKTLHKKFTIGVPIFLILQVMLFVWFLSRYFAQG